MAQRRNKNISHLAATQERKAQPKAKELIKTVVSRVSILDRIHSVQRHNIQVPSAHASTVWHERSKACGDLGTDPLPKSNESGAGLTLERPSLAVIRRRGRGMCGAEEPLGGPISARLSAQRSRGATTKRKSAGWYLETGLGPNARSLLLHSTLAPCTPAWCLAGVCRSPRRHFLSAAIPFKTMPRPPWQPSILLFPTNRHHEVRYRPVSSPATLEVCSGASLLSGAFRFCC